MRRIWLLLAAVALAGALLWLWLTAAAWWPVRLSVGPSDDPWATVQLPLPT